MTIRFLMGAVIVAHDSPHLQPSYMDTPYGYVELVPADFEQQPVVANLLQLYAYDFSEFHPVELGADGRFAYKNLELYWREPGRRPFLIRCDGKLAGFAFAKQGSELSGNDAVWDVAEFFVIRSFRGQGIGTKAAHALWTALPGWWEVRVMQENRTALSFWQSAVASFCNESIGPITLENDGSTWYLFAFESKEGSGHPK